MSVRADVGGVPRTHYRCLKVVPCDRRLLPEWALRSQGYTPTAALASIVQGRRHE